MRGIAITGAAGFVGRAVVRRFALEGCQVRALVRERPADAGTGFEMVKTGNLNTCQNLSQLFEGCDVVVNLVARVHVTKERERNPDQAFLATNRDLSLRLARAANAAGVRRFVQMSSVAALRSVTFPGEIVDDASQASPQNAYGRSKLAADTALAEISSETGLSIVSLRPPVVFGPDVGAHFRQLMRCARMGLPLPIGNFDNKRSAIFLENLADATFAAAKGDAQGAFVVTDSAPRTTAEIYRELLLAFGHSQWLPSLPKRAVRAVAGTLLGNRVDSLLGWSAFEGGRFRSAFDWEAPIGFEQAIAMTVRGNGTRGGKARLA